MTRINSAIPVKNLTDEHLLAEHREIKRLPCCLGKSIKSGSIRKIPSKFTLGNGHVLYFLDKQEFLYNRYLEIHNELIKRGFIIQNYSDNWNHLKHSKYWFNHGCDEHEKHLLVERISTRINESKKKCFHYYKSKISKEKAIELLKEL